MPHVAHTFNDGHGICAHGSGIGIGHWTLPCSACLACVLQLEQQVTKGELLRVLLGASLLQAQHVPAPSHCVGQLWSAHEVWRQEVQQPASDRAQVWMISISGVQ